jgi:hypothetical protein
MEVTHITHSPISGYDAEAVRTFEALQGISSKQQPEKVEPSSQSWKKKILLDALDVLENKIQVDNNHPLSSEDYAPIESFEEALIELSFLKDDVFKREASNAQANVNPSSILELFADERAFFKAV